PPLPQADRRRRGGGRPLQHVARVPGPAADRQRDRLRRVRVPGPVPLRQVPGRLQARRRRPPLARRRAAAQGQPCRVFALSRPLSRSLALNLVLVLAGGRGGGSGVSKPRSRTPRSISAIAVSTTLTLAKRLDSASTRYQGASGWSVRSSMSSIACS